MSFRNMVRDLRESLGNISKRNFEVRIHHRGKFLGSSSDMQEEPVVVQQSRWASLPPELLRDVMERLEEDENSWPSRKDVVACASVCRTWRDICKDIVRTPEFCSKLTFPVSLKQPGPRDGMIQCFIKRDRSKRTYHLYLCLTSEYITRRVLAPQVNNLLQIAQKYQSTAAESGPTGVSNNDTQTICNMFVTASRQLVKNLEHHTLNEHGFSKRYVRCLQISEVVNHMKDLIEFTSKNNLGPIEGLNKFCKSSVQKLSVQNMHESKQLMAAAGLPNDQSTTKAMEVKQEMSAHVNRSAHVVGATDNNVAQNGASNYQNVIRSSGANQSVLQHEASNVFKGTAAMHNGIRLEASRSFRGPNQGQLAQFEHTMSLQHPMPQQNNFQGLGVHNNFQGLTASPQYQQHVLHQLLAAAKNTNNQPLVQQPPPDNPNVNSSLASVAANSNHAASREQAQRINEGTTKDACTMGTGPSNVINNSTVSMLPSRSNSFKSVSNNPASPSTGGNAAASKAESFHEMDDLDHLDDIINNQLVESGLFEGDQGGNGFLWNM